MCGLTLVFYRSLLLTRLSRLGMGFDLGTLLCLVSSVGAQLVYGFIRSGSLVNSTSLFYLVTVVPVILDYLILCSSMPALAVADCRLAHHHSADLTGDALSNRRRTLPPNFYDKSSPRTVAVSCCAQPHNAGVGEAVRVRAKSAALAGVSSPRPEPSYHPLRPTLGRDRSPIAYLEDAKAP